MMFTDEPTPDPMTPNCPRRALVALALLALLLGGCAGETASLQLVSNSSGRTYNQNFSRAFYTVGEGGEYDIILSEDGIVSAPARSSGPLATSTAAAPLNQMVYIRVQWRPMRGTKPDAPTATNAVIDWYVRTNDPNGANHLHYRGAGFVQLYGGDPEIRFVVRNAHVELTGSAGKLSDPLGPSNLTGGFIATRNDAHVNSTLSFIREQFAARPAAHPPGHDGPPPRAPAGP